MSDLRIERAHKSYGEVHAVRGVDLAIPEGEFAVLVGPSGCGKSTLLRMIAGLETVDEGDVVIGGVRVNDLRPRDRDVAMVFQSYALYPYLTVFENIAFPLRARKLPGREIGGRVREAARVLGLTAHLPRYPRQLSGGQRQRVAIGRAIVRDAGLFLFDEPLSNLDAQLREEMRIELKRLHQRLGKTFVYVTHDQIEAMTLADRIVLLRDGLVEQEGSPLDLFERPRTRFVAGFLGSPAMNFLAGRVALDGGCCAVSLGEDVRLAFPPERGRALAARVCDGDEVTLGVRPEHIGPAGADRDGARVSATVDLVQPTGTRLYVQFRLAGAEVTAELAAHRVERPGDAIRLEIDMARAILIDPESGLVL